MWITEQLSRDHKKVGILVSTLKGDWTCEEKSILREEKN